MFQGDNVQEQKHLWSIAPYDQLVKYSFPSSTPTCGQPGSVYRLQWTWSWCSGPWWNTPEREGPFPPPSAAPLAVWAAQNNDDKPQAQQIQLKVSYLDYTSLYSDPADSTSRFPQGTLAEDCAPGYTNSSEDTVRTNFWHTGDMVIQCNNPLLFLNLYEIQTLKVAPSRARYCMCDRFPVCT